VKENEVGVGIAGANQATEEMRAAIDGATRSLEAGKGIPLEEVRQRFLAKWATK
jgi:hypothetical protein